tara:strand:+ start:2168 stop:3118 length:951 start_codon:yes stop_codon:yes gene_type:complete
MKKLLTFLASIVCFTTFNAQCQVVTNGLKAHFNFENNLLDNSGNNKHLAVTNGVAIYDQRDSANFSLFLDGLSTISSINSFDNSNYTQAAVSIWIKTVNFSNTVQTCFQAAYMGFGAYIEATTGKFMGFFDSSSSGAAKSTNAINDGNWHHVVMQNNGSVTFLYIDGILDIAIPDNLVVGNGGSNNKFYMGKTNQGLNVFKGSIDDFRIYDRMLTNLEIDSLYNQHIAVSTINNLRNETVEVSIFPNPTVNIITLDFKQTYSNIEIKVTDLLGKLVVNKSLSNSQRTEIEILGKSGIYLLSIILDEKVVTYKIIKE